MELNAAMEIQPAKEVLRRIALYIQSDPAFAQAHTAKKPQSSQNNGRNLKESGLTHSRDSHAFSFSLVTANINHALEQAAGSCRIRENMGKLKITEFFRQRLEPECGRVGRGELKAILILKNLKVSAGLMDHFLVKQNLRDLT
ncbi:hypothetical protein [Piscirickettsia salmonis]|uniref:hypothetical protein n=1 Tax=Piscirickettsia salmonis TaxID=1238 RepID=UPI003A80A443